MTNPYRKHHHRPTDRSKVRAHFRFLDAMTGQHTGLGDEPKAEPKAVNARSPSCPSDDFHLAESISIRR